MEQQRKWKTAGFLFKNNEKKKKKTRPVYSTLYAIPAALRPRLVNAHSRKGICISTRRGGTFDRRVRAYIQMRWSAGLSAATAAAAAARIRAAADASMRPLTQTRRISIEPMRRRQHVAAKIQQENMVNKVSVETQRKTWNHNSWIRQTKWSKPFSSLKFNKCTVMSREALACTFLSNYSEWEGYSRYVLV